MGWWSRLLRRRAEVVPPSRALPAPESEPAPEAPLQPPADAAPEPPVDPAPERPADAAPEPDDREISPGRLDQALQRLRSEIPAQDDGSHG